LAIDSAGFEQQQRPERCAKLGLLRKKLVVEHDVEKRTVDLQCITSVIINEPQFPEPVHEKVNP
jgi:hypothetical protein